MRMQVMEFTDRVIQNSKEKLKKSYSTIISIFERITSYLATPKITKNIFCDLLEEVLQ